MQNDTLPEWERVLSSAAQLQRILPETVLVGGTAAAVYTAHRLSVDTDHVLTDLRQRFDQVLAELESVAGWKTARVRRPVLILGNLDGIETGIRQLIRDEPLETTQVERLGEKITQTKNRPCSSYRFNWPNHCPTISKNSTWPNTRTLTRAGVTGKTSRQRALIMPP